MVCSLHYTDKESAINLLKQHLTKAAAGRMKQITNKRRSERVFEIGDMVYLKLKPFGPWDTRGAPSQEGNAILSSSFFSMDHSFVVS